MRKLTPLENEWNKVVKREQLFLKKRGEKRESGIVEILEKKVPRNLQNK